MEQSIARQWAQKKKTRPVTLPSGMTIQIKVSILYSAMLANILPVPLLKRILKGDAKDATPEESIQLPAIMQQMFGLVMQMVADPVIVDRPTRAENEISLVDVPDEDMMFLVGMIFRSEGAEEIGRFRNGSRGPDAGPDVPAVQPAPVLGDAG